MAECFYPGCKAHKLFVVAGDGIRADSRYACLDHMGHAIATDMVSGGQSFEWTVTELRGQ